MKSMLFGRAIMENPRAEEVKQLVFLCTLAFKSRMDMKNACQKIHHYGACVCVSGLQGCYKR